jgi:membrane protein implicated in regulation of membrane protease activity
MNLVQEKTYYVGQPRPEKPTTREWVRPLWFLFTVGWYVVLSLIIPTLIGFWLDSPERFNTHPLFTLIGFALGSVLAFYGLYRMMRKFYREQKENEQDRSKEPK